MTLTTMVIVGGILVSAFVVSRLVQRAMTRALAMRGITDAGTIGVSLRLAHYAIVLLGLGIGLQTLGLNLGALFTAGAFFAVAPGFAMQNIAQNFVAGLLLLTERTIKPGDVLDVENRVVRVSRMASRSPVALPRDEEELVMPNSTLVQRPYADFPP